MNSVSPTTAHIARYRTSSAFLDEAGTVCRQPRAPKRRRPSQFYSDFEDRALIYDAFFYGDAGTVLLIGPPPDSLAGAYDAARYTALPSGKALSAAYFKSRSTMITRLGQVPDGTTAVAMNFANQVFTIEIQPDAATDFAGRRLLFTINKNNRLEWIRAWAAWHARMHGTDAIILFDNGSTDYAAEDLEDCIASVPGLKRIAVISLPHKFGPVDSTALAYHFWPRFLQISATSIALRRFGMRAHGILNCDIDELVWAEGQSVYELAADSRLGMLRIPGRWIEAAHDGEYPKDHFGFRFRARGLRAHLSPPKCALDPTREWVKDLRVHPYLHRIHGAPRGGRHITRQARFFHFRGINTNWKEDRTSAVSFDPARHVRDDMWIAAKIEQGLDRS